MSFTRTIYRCYRTSKNKLQDGSGLLSKGFFVMLGIAERILSFNSRWRKSDPDWDAKYRSKFGAAAIYRIETTSPVALVSVDHTLPRGAIHDNTVHRPFNRALHRFFQTPEQISVLDLGCAGGGFVKSLLEDGDLAVGVEGSDLPKRGGFGEWRACPLHLFTADICQPFTVRLLSGEPILFDAVTAWEVLEHIPEASVPLLAANVAKHLKVGGIFVASVDSTPDRNPLTGAVYHVTLQPKAWWVDIFNSYGLKPIQPEPFSKSEYVRGNALGIKNWDPDFGDGFHLVLTKQPA